VRLTPCQIALAVFLALMCGLDVLWIRMNRAPPRMFDDTHFLIESLDVYEALHRQGFRGFVEESLKPARGFHPPMIKILPVPLYLLLGPGAPAALASFALLIPVFGVYLFLLTRRLAGSEKTALLAVVVTCLFPLTYGMWRNMMAEFGTALAAVASLYHLVKAAESRRPVHSILAGAFLGWGLLWKVSFPLFVIGPVVYLRPRGRHLALAAAAAALVAGPFYLVSGQQVLDWLALSIRPEPNQPWSLGPVFATGTLLRYWISNVNFGVSVYFLVLLMAAWILAAFHRKAIPWRAVAFAVAWLVPAFAVLSFQVLKEIRHLLPAYAAVGILIGAGLAGALNAARSRRIEVAALALLGIWPLYQFGASSFDPDWLPRRDLRWGPWVLSTADLELASLQIMPVYTFPAGRTAWPARQTVDGIARHAGATIRDRTPRVRVAGNNPFFNGLVLDYHSRLAGHRWMFYSAFDRNLSKADFVVTVSTPGRKYGPLDEGDPLLQRLLDERRLPFAPLDAISFGDANRVRIYRRISDPPLPGWKPPDASGWRETFMTPSGPRSVLVTDPGAEIKLTYLYVPVSGASIRVGFGVDAGKVSSRCPRACQVTATELENDARPQVLVSATIDPAAGRAESRWQEVSLSLDSFRGQIVEVALSVRADPSGEAGCNRIGWDLGER